MPSQASQWWNHFSADLGIPKMRPFDTFRPKLPPVQSGTIDRPNEFQIRGWPDWLHFDAEVEKLEGATLRWSGLRVEQECVLWRCCHCHGVACEGGEFGE